MKRFLTMAVAFAGLTAMTNVHAVPVLYGANGHHYEYIAWSGASQSWTTAAAAAAGLSFNGVAGHLATIADGGENAFVASLLGGRSWIGLSDAATEGVYQWVDGSIFGYTNWSGGEPNDPSNTAQEDYVEMFTNGAWNDNSNLDPTPSFRTTGYVVEYDTVPPAPEPLSAALLAAGLFGIALGRRRAGGARVRTRRQGR